MSFNVAKGITFTLSPIDMALSQIIFSTVTLYFCGVLFCILAEVYFVFLWQMAFQCPFSKQILFLGGK